MDQYVTEEQQVEALKKWWKANRSSIIVGIAIGLAIVFGWQYWSSYRTAQAEQASLQYNALSQAVEAANSQQIRHQGQALLESFPSSFYAVLTAFELAKLATEEGDTATAVRHLQWVVDHADEGAIKDIARLRLARVLLAAGRLDDAQAQLDRVSEGSNFAAELEELKGDLFVARNEPAKARSAYQAALGASSGNALLRMKLEDLPASGTP